MTLQTQGLALLLLCISGALPAQSTAVVQPQPQTAQPSQLPDYWGQSTIRAGIKGQVARRSSGPSAVSTAEVGVWQLSGRIVFCVHACADVLGSSCLIELSERTSHP